MQFNKPSGKRNLLRQRGPALDVSTTSRSAFQNQYGNHNIQFYNLPPTESISLKEFEELAFLRLKVLKAVEQTREKYGKGDEFFQTLDNEMRRLNFRISLKATNPEKEEEQKSVLEDRRKDYLSHFILRLAFCRSPDAQKWFLQQEVDLFKFRFRADGSKGIESFLVQNGFDYKMLEEKEKKLLASTLAAAVPSSKFSATVAGQKEFWKVPFIEALDLVRNRKVWLHHGMAYIPNDDLGVIVAARFRQNLSKALVVASKHFGVIAEDDRLLPVLKRLSNKAYIGKDYTNNNDAKRVTPAMVDTLSKESFPLCMREMHHNLRQNHHMRHGGRMQYGLFLKGIGMTLDDAMEFWRKEFTKIIDSDKFDKQYAYNIRHNYGKEGKRADYTPYHCLKIITGNPPGPQDAHGCPFKHYDVDQLKQRLEALDMKPDRMKKILGFTKAGRYDQACTRFFEATHKMPEESLGFLIGHPNHFYEESRKFHSGQKLPQAVPVVESQVFERADVDDAEMLAIEEPEL